MDQQSRLWLAIALSLLVYVAYDVLILRPQREAQFEQTAVPDSLPPPEVVAEGPAPETPGLPVPEAVPTATGMRAAPAGDPITVDTPLYRATVTPKGGRLASFTLKKHREAVADDSPPLELVVADGSPILPLTVWLADGTSDAEVTYSSSKTSVDLRDEAVEEIVLTGALASGVTIEKRLAVTGSSYLIDLSIKVAGEGAPAALGLIVPPLPEIESYSYYGDQGVALIDEKLVEHDPESMVAEAARESNVTWAGFSGQYFASVGIAPEAPLGAVFGSESGEAIVRVDAPTEGGVASFKLLIGPKERRRLESEGSKLSSLLDFGWFWFIALPLLMLLDVVEQWVGNYGLAIVLVTVLIKVVTYPLTQTSMTSMRKMQELQPQLQKLRERNKEDPAAMQKDMMDLYKKHNVNPLSGCLPMLLQIPIFVGLYNGLLNAIELRHAPFVGWITDLSAPDRLHMLGVGVPVLTLIMGASMLVQQLMMPAQGDPMQRRMMLIMPVVFTFMFINFPSGLVLYWLVNNVLSIGQQYLALRSPT